MVEVKEGLPEAPLSVALLGNRLGHEIKKPGASFRLSNIYDHEPMAGNDVFTRVYFRTDSGNIYSLDTNGKLVNGKENQGRGAIVQTSLQTEKLKGQKLTIGEPFSYGSSGKTSVVTEIVPVVEHRTYIPEALRQITNGKTNSIRADFYKMLPPQKIGESKEDLQGRVGPEDLEELKRIRAGDPPKAEKKQQATPPPAKALRKEEVQSKDEEAPKRDVRPKASQEVRNLQDKELEQKAAELANATREQGMGRLFGKFPPRVSPPHTVGGFIDTGHFIQGEDIPGSDRATLMFTYGNFGTASLPIYASAMSGTQPNVERPIWNSRNFVPPEEYVYIKEPITRERRKPFFRVEKYKDTQRVKKFTGNLFNYHGKHGESDWVKYEYIMGLFNYPYDSRPAFVMMTVAVPPDLAVQIDEQVEKNVYFPDAFFQAVYPGYVGQDTHKDIKRKPAKEIEIVNDRTGVRKVVQYPQPIPY